MKKIILLSGILMASVFVFAQKTEFNDPDAELRDAKNFHGISVSNAFDVYLSQGNDEAVAVSASETKVRDKIKVEVKDGMLHIYLEGDQKFWRIFKGNRLKLKAYISFKTLDKIRVSGACDVRMSGTLTSDNLDVNLSGASDWKEGKLDVKKLDVNISGASRMSVTGSAANIDVDASGASDFKGYDFTVDYCDAKASGASNVSITVNKELSARASGASNVRFKGEGLIRNIHTSGASNISRRS